MPLNPATRAAIKTLYNALNDRVLEAGDPVYVAQVNCQGQHDAIEEIATEIDFQDGGGVYLFTGQRGTGKSTELKRLKKQLEDADVTVFYADLAEFMLLSKEVEISDFLVSVCGAMSEQVQDTFGAAPGNRGYWERFNVFLQTRVEVGEFDIALPVLDIKAALKNDPDFKRRVQEAARGHVATLVKDAHDFLVEAVSFVRGQLQDPARKVVLLVDSVERIRGVGSDAMKVYESVRNLFFGHGEHLRIPLLHIVYTIPPYLSVLASGAGNLMGGAVARRLVTTHLFKDRSREPDPVGIGVLLAVVTARYPAWETLLRRAAVERLALSSGGDMREFFRLLRQCLPAIRDDTQVPLSIEAAAVVEDAARGEMLPIPTDQLGWLKRIARTHETCLDSESDLPTLAHFLDNRLVMNYRNGSDWYDVHPLLRKVIDAHIDAAA